MGEIYVGRGGIRAMTDQGRIVRQISRNKGNETPSILVTADHLAVY